MNVLCIGDVVGAVGCRHLEQTLPRVKRELAVDVCIVNGENSADGNGITPVSAGHIFDAGADVITGGNRRDAVAVGRVFAIDDAHVHRQLPFDPGQCLGQMAATRRAHHVADT